MLITTEAAHTPAWDQVFPNRPQASGTPNRRSPYSVWSPGGRKSGSGRSASRLPTGEGCGMKSGRKFRTMRFLAEHRSFRPSSHLFPKRPGPVAPRIKAGLGDISSRILGTGSAKDRLKAHQFVPMDPQLPGLNSFALHTAGPVQRRRPQALSLGRILEGRRYPPNGLESTIATCHPAARHFDAAADAPDPVRIATRSKFFFIISLRLPLSPLRANAWHVETNSIKSGLCAHIQGLTVLIAPRHVVRVLRTGDGAKVLTFR